MKLDILVLAPHPDDAELGCGGTIARHTAQGLKVGIIDFTQGELSTRGTPEIRQKEAAEAAKVLGVTVRENLGLADGFFVNDRVTRIELIRKIRTYCPTIILASAVEDRHPDHGRAAALAQDVFFLSGLEKIKTADHQGMEQAPWRPSVMYHYIQSQYLTPHFIVDISEQWEQKEKAIRSYKSQFFDPQSKEPETYISRQGFLDMVKARAVDFGLSIGAGFGEGFTIRRTPGVRRLTDLI